MNDAHNGEAVKRLTFFLTALPACTLLWPIGRPPSRDLASQESFPDDGYGEIFVPSADAGALDASMIEDAATDDAGLSDGSEPSPCGDPPDGLELGAFCEGPAGQCPTGFIACVGTSLYCWCDDEYPRCDCPPWR
jgi:hypothetical protein